MKQDVKEKWTAALRSGQYPQGKWGLHGRDGYCCLGVLCDLAYKEGVVSRLEAPNNYGDYTYDGSYSYLPNSVVQWAGMDDPTGLYHARNADESFDGKWSLAADNDAGKPFSDIADIIDREF